VTHFLKKIEPFLKNYYILLVISFVGVVLIIIPFIISNNLEGFDAPGQYASAYYIKNFFWPWPSGWNLMFLSGFPQGLFYPPLFHWLVATLSFIIPLILSYKIILAVAIFLFPIIFFVLSLSIFKNYLLSSTALIMVSILYYFDLGLNDNLFSDIYFGMAPHLFSLTIFLAYVYFLIKLISNYKKWTTASFLLAILIITHPITGFVALLLGAICLILSWPNSNLKHSFLKHLFFGCLISSWWWLPALINISYISGGNASAKAESVILLFTPLVFIISFLTFKIKSNLSILFRAIAVFNFLIITLYLVSNLFPLHNFPIHFSRFLIYPLLLAPIQLVFFLQKKNIDWQKLNLVFLFCFCFYIFNFRIIPIGPFGLNILGNVEKNWLGGRFISSGDSKNLDDRFHVAKIKLATEYNLPNFGGLFVESSANGWFIMSLTRSWDKITPDFIWAYKDLKDVINLDWGSRVFGINYEYRISDKKPSEEEIDFIAKKESLLKYSNNYKKEGQDLDFKINRQRLLDDEQSVSLFDDKNWILYYQSLYKINDSSIAEALSVKPVNIEKSWLINIRKWWTTDWLKIENSLNVYDKPVLVYKANTENWQLNSENKNLALEFNKKMDSFVVDASSLKNSAPIYVKVSYFPFWQAFDEFGKKLEIYKASPNFMLVYGHGKITFKYINPAYYYYSFIISGLAFLFLIIKKIKK
jgi:hypothetical protein